eukprot:1161681-Pelagomonas_calceolata.AAC.3
MCLWVEPKRSSTVVFCAKAKQVSGSKESSPASSLLANHKCFAVLVAHVGDLPVARGARGVAVWPSCGALSKRSGSSGPCTNAAVHAS